MRTIGQPQSSLRNGQIFVNITMAFTSFVLWLGGDSVISLMPWFCLASALVVARHALFATKLPGMLTWFSISYIGLFLVYPILAPLFDIEIPTSDEVYLDYCFLAIAGVHLFVVGYELASPHRAKRYWVKFPETTSYRVSKLVMWLLILNMVAVFVVAVDAGASSAILSETRNDLMSRSGVLSLVGVYLLGIGSVLYPLAAVGIYHQRIHSITWIPILICLELALFLTFRVRTFAVMHAVGLLVGWFVIAPRMAIVTANSSNHRELTHLTAVQKAMIFALLITLVMSMFVLRTFRGQIENVASFSDIQINLTESARFALEGGGELGYSQFVFRILEVVPAEQDYLYGQSYYRLLFIAIPRRIWPNKPLDSQRLTAHWIDPDASIHQTTPVGIVGDLYANFGKCGVFGMFVFGCAFGLVDRGTHLTHALFMAVSFPMIFHMARGSFTNTVVELSVYYLISRVIANQLCRVPKRSRIGFRPNPHAPLNRDARNPVRVTTNQQHHHVALVHSELKPIHGCQKLRGDQK